MKVTCLTFLHLIKVRIDEKKSPRFFTSFEKKSPARQQAYVGYFNNEIYFNIKLKKKGIILDRQMK